ncbi:MAG: hypothetical protein LC687_06765 [Actinobacteria bacterium]|nr:hypothetical protein [Actinomycetota bacterium]
MLQGKKGQAANVVAGIVGITVAVIMLANVFFPQVVDTNTSTWDSAAVTLWDTLQVAGAIGAVILTFRALGVI